MSRMLSDSGLLGWKTLHAGDLCSLPEHDRVRVVSPYHWRRLYHLPGWVPLSDVLRHLPPEPAS